MKKRVFAVLTAAAVAAGVFSGCEVTSESTHESSFNVETTVEEDAEEDDERAAAFATLQDDYAKMVEYYNEVTDYYMDDSVVQSDEVEKSLSEAKELIDEIGDIEEGDFADVDEINEMDKTVQGIIDGLSGVVGMMDDLTFEQVQENYRVMVDYYNQVEEYYMDDSIKQSDAVEKSLSEAKQLIEEIGEIEESDFANAGEMEEMNKTMQKIIDDLDDVVESMEAS